MKEITANSKSTGKKTFLPVTAIRQLTLIPTSNRWAPLHTLGVQKKIILAQMSLKSKKTTAMHRSPSLQTTKDYKADKQISSSFPIAFFLQFASVLNRYLTSYYNTKLFQVFFTVFYRTFLKIEEYYLPPQHTERKVSMKYTPQPAQHPTGSLLQSRPESTCYYLFLSHI